MTILFQCNQPSWGSTITEVYLPTTTKERKRKKGQTTGKAKTRFCGPAHGSRHAAGRSLGEPHSGKKDKRHSVHRARWGPRTVLLGSKGWEETAMAAMLTLSIICLHARQYTLIMLSTENCNTLWCCVLKNCNTLWCCVLKNCNTLW